jgi:hypothetical protein
MARDGFNLLDKMKVIVESNCYSAVCIFADSYPGSINKILSKHPIAVKIKRARKFSIYKHTS